MALIAKAKKRLHALMREAVSSHKCIDFNSIKIDDPTDYIVCTPEGDMKSFRRLTKGDILVYSEIINSTPIEDDGYTVKDVKLAQLCNNSCHNVFTKQSVFKFVESIKNMYFHSWVTEDEVNGMRIWYACGLVWIAQNVYQVYQRGSSNHELLWMKPDMVCKRKRCCECGYVSVLDNDMCEHMRNPITPSFIHKTLWSVEKVTRLYLSPNILISKS